MLVKNIIYEDFVNYKKPSMFIIFPFCTFKCEQESGVYCCQNKDLTQQNNIKISTKDIIQKYIGNPITSAIVCGGLEPFNSWSDLIDLVSMLREYTYDDIVIYTGYNKSEIEKYIEYLKEYKNIIIKFGRFIPDSEQKYDEVLGVTLASSNQYAERIS